MATWTFLKIAQKIVCINKRSEFWRGGGAAAVFWEQCGIRLSMGIRNTKLNCVLNSFCPLISKVNILEMSFYFFIVFTSPL